VFIYIFDLEQVLVMYNTIQIQYPISTNVE